MPLSLVPQYIIDYGYLLIIPISAALGPPVAVLGGLLLHLYPERFGFFQFYLALMAGELIGDVVWYALGRKWGRGFISRFGKFFSITDVIVQKIETLFHIHHDKILFFSKLTTGFGFAPVVLFTAGLSKVPFKRYMVLNFLGQFVWTAFLLAIGYFFGNLFRLVDKSFKLLSLFAFIALFMGALYGFGKYASKRLLAYIK
ncbi:MAG: VTT domain-containing protein [Patescibacteria group bacterium]